MNKKKSYNVAVVGARGAVGHEMIKILQERKFPVAELRPFGSERSKGTAISFEGRSIPVHELGFKKQEFDGIDIVLSSPGASVSKKFVPLAIEAGAVVIDNTSAFRMDPQVPLVVPEVNADQLKKHKGLIANPNCTAMIMLTAIGPLYRKNRIKRIVCATYQSASGAGASAMRELLVQSRQFLGAIKSEDDLFNGTIYTDQFLNRLNKNVFPHQIAFNLFSHNAAIEEDGYNGEENKMMREVKKILDDDQIRMTTTCVRVPVFQAHAEALYLEFEKKMTVEEARDVLRRAPGVKLVDEREKNYFPMPIEASGKDDVLVGRIREDFSVENGLALFVAGDQLRKGAALNAVQIAEELIKS